MSDQIIARRIAAIGEDREHGSTLLTLKAVRVLGEAAEGALSDARWAWDLARTARQLADAKPAMAGVRNASAQLLGRLLALGPVEGRRQATTLAEGLVTALREASASAAARAASLLPQDAAVATCSFSSAVLETLRAATEQGKGAHVLVLESGRSPAAHGLRLAASLREAGVDVEVVPGNAATDAVRRATLALVGADAVAPGCIVNGTPTLALAQASKSRIPFYVVCEMVKMVAQVVAAPGYDAVPIELVTAVVTEDGAHSPEEIGRRLSVPKDA